MMTDQHSDRFAFPAIVVSAVLLYVLLLAYMPFTDFAYDAWGHLDYIKRLMKGQELFLDPRDGWEFFQPPLYYALAAGFASLASVMIGVGPDDLVISIRVFSLILYLGYLWFCMKTIREFVASRDFQFVALIILCFWPVGIFMASRVNNDILLYLFYGAAFYHMMRWYHAQSRKDFFYTLIFSSLAVATKSNGLLLFIILGALMLIKRPRLRAMGWQLWAVGLVCLLICATNLGRIVYYHVAEDRPLVLVPNIEIGQDFSEMNIRNTPQHLFGFDLPIYLTVPFFNTRDDSSGRQYFFNSMLKSALFGEFSAWRNPTLALILSNAFLVLVLYALVVAVMLARNRAHAALLLPFALSFVIQVVSLLAARVASPTPEIAISCGQDFRYIYPSLVPFLIVYGKNLELTRASGQTVLSTTGNGILLCFTALCFTFAAYQVVL